MAFGRHVSGPTSTTWFSAESGSVGAGDPHSRIGTLGHLGGGKKTTVDHESFDCLVYSKSDVFKSHGSSSVYKYSFET